MPSDISSKYCAQCIRKLPIASFLQHATARPDSKVFVTCISCRKKARKRRAARSTSEPHPSESRPKRGALQPLNPNRRSEATSVQPPLDPPLDHPAPEPPPVPRVNAPPISPRRSEPPPVPGFLSAQQWEYIQRFNMAMQAVKMETFLRCKERWFAMDLKGDTCHACFLRDKGIRRLFLCPSRIRWTQETYQPSSPS